MYKNIIIVKEYLEIYTIRYVVLKPDELQGEHAVDALVAPEQQLDEHLGLKSFVNYLNIALRY